QNIGQSCAGVYGGTDKYLSGANAMGLFETGMASPRNIATNSVETSTSHTHTITIDAFNSGGQAFDIVPAFYTVIYIMKIA
ncbi:MAG: hypothetical protein LBJ25_08535, partial [Candidatus Margulisbacteria bacterium]|nr:hypothetical protein [Candidatus Margulisiibacteriota bacterium]